MIQSSWVFQVILRTNQIKRKTICQSLCILITYPSYHNLLSPLSSLSETSELWSIAATDGINFKLGLRKRLKAALDCSVLELVWSWALLLVDELSISLVSGTVGRLTYMSGMGISWGFCILTSLSAADLGRTTFPIPR